MVFFRLKNHPVLPDLLADFLARQNILINSHDEGVFRVVTHYWITREDLEQLVELLVS